MVCSVFDLFKIGVGPSSSHTMGPMTAACRFVEGLAERNLLAATERVQVDLYGSLALTGKGHATDRAILLGLAGERPESIDPDAADAKIERIRASARPRLGGTHEIGFARDAADRVVFMDGGVVVESGPPGEVLVDPKHPRTRAFLSRFI